MDVQPALKTHAQLAETGEPGVGSLDHPAMPSQSILAFDALAGNPCRDTSFSQVMLAPHVIVAFVGMQLTGPLSWPTIQSRYRRDCIQRAFERHRIVPVRSRDRNGQRDASCIYDDMAFAAEFSPVSRVGAGFLAPSGARYAGPINTGTTPINLVVLTQPLQKGQMQLRPNAGGLPITQPPPARHPAAKAQFLRQLLPRNASV